MITSIFRNSARINNFIWFFIKCLQISFIVFLFNIIYNFILFLKNIFFCSRSVLRIKKISLKIDIWTAQVFGFKINIFFLELLAFNMSLPMFFCKRFKLLILFIISTFLYIICFFWIYNLFFVICLVKISR